MALKGTVFKVELTIADMSRHYYHCHKLTVARHPSESDTRMLARLLAFALNADKRLEFTRGLCVDEEPELWQRELDGSIIRWIELGEPKEKYLRKASRSAQAVLLYCYGGQPSITWWQRMRERLSRMKTFGSLIFLAPF